MATHGEPKLDPARMWFRVSQIGPICLGTAFVVALYFGITKQIDDKHRDANDKHRDAIAMIREVITTQERKSERDDRNNRDLVDAIERVREEIRVQGDGWRARIEQWIEHFRAANAVRMPDLVVPPLPK